MTQWNHSPSSLKHVLQVAFRISYSNFLPTLLCYRFLLFLLLPISECRNGQWSFLFLYTIYVLITHKFLSPAWTSLLTPTLANTTVYWPYLLGCTNTMPPNEFLTLLPSLPPLQLSVFIGSTFKIWQSGHSPLLLLLSLRTQLPRCTVWVTATVSNLLNFLFLPLTLKILYRPLPPQPSGDQGPVRRVSPPGGNGRGQRESPPPHPHVPREPGAQQFLDYLISGIREFQT